MLFLTDFSDLVLQRCLIISCTFTGCHSVILNRLDLGFYGLQKKNSFGANSRSSLPEVFCKKGVLRNFAKFTGKHLCQSLFFLKKDSGTDVFLCLRPATFFKKRDSSTCVFLWILQNFLEHLFLQNTSGGCFPKRLGCVRPTRDYLQDKNFFLCWRHFDFEHFEIYF